MLVQNSNTIFLLFIYLLEGSTFLLEFGKLIMENSKMNYYSLVLSKILVTVLLNETQSFSLKRVAALFGGLVLRFFASN